MKGDHALAALTKVYGEVDWTDTEIIAAALGERHGRHFAHLERTHDSAYALMRDLHAKLRPTRAELALMATGLNDLQGWNEEHPGEKFGFVFSRGIAISWFEPDGTLSYEIRLNPSLH